MRIFGAIVIFAIACALSCGESERAEVVVSVDIDMLLPSQLDEATSPDAVVDTLRVEVRDSEQKLIDHRVLALGAASSLPLSFGVPAEFFHDGVANVRLRAFRASLASPGELAGKPVLDPRPEVTVDRVLTLALPSEGVTHASVVLHGDCIGVAPRFVAGQPDSVTCIDATTPAGSSKAGFEDRAVSTSSVAGTWALARYVPCEGVPPPGAVCIPGGLTIVGEPIFAAQSEFVLDAIPLRVAYSSPFYLDVHEFTIGELRQAVSSGYAGPLPDPKETTGEDAFCTWDPGSLADLPVNCISVEVADRLCETRGGATPTEVQWEHAARGRGERRLYTWGDEAPQCCSASMGRSAGDTCGDGPEVVGLHLGTADCPGDVSRDGVVDLVGSLSELTNDSAGEFTDPCWTAPEGTGILRDWVCHGSITRGARGGAWGFPRGDAPTPIRRKFSESDQGYGFRCAYGAGVR